jgi:hypothetical protein
MRQNMMGTMMVGGAMNRSRLLTNNCIGQISGVTFFAKRKLQKIRQQKLAQ